MKLSEAIRLGAMLKPQGFGMLFDGARTCAMGAAHEAIFGEMSEFDIDDSCSEVYALFDTLLSQRMACPTCGYAYRRTYRVIHHLNDKHKWNREQIADWVATIEAQQESPAIEQPALMKVGA